MALQDYETLMVRCNRCSYCKVVPHAVLDDIEYDNICPSIARYHFHGYSGGGKMISALALLRGRIDYTEEYVEMIYKCMVDGGCDVSCKVNRDLEPLQVLLELRAKCVEDGEMLPEHLMIIDHLRKEDNMMLARKADRGDWADDLDVKDLTTESAEVLFHAGCHYSFNEALWPVARKSVELLRKAGVDVGIMGKQETCCGGRAYEMGFKAELVKFCEHTIDMWKSAGVKTIVTACSDCYHSFNVKYDMIGHKPDIEIIHITQYLERLIQQGRLKLTKEVPMVITYHDPCHLGRLGEAWAHWNGTETKVLGQLVGFDPPREFRRGSQGVYETPRNLLKSIPGVTLIEMHRIKEYAWCCGSGGGVKESFPDFAEWTAAERLKEAESTGAEAIVTACPWCAANFNDTMEHTPFNLKVYDVLELLYQATESDKKQSA
jgi:Fe-S oxidoreductase